MVHKTKQQEAPPPPSAPEVKSQKNKQRNGPLTREEIEKERERQKRILKEKYPGAIVPPWDGNP